MSIRARAKHVLSVMLIVIVAFSGSARASVDHKAHCVPQMSDCHEMAVFTCCDSSAPVPIDRAPLPGFAPTPGHVQSAGPMDHIVPQSPAVRMDDVSSPHWVRVLDLQLLNQSFVI